MSVRDYIHPAWRTFWFWFYRPDLDHTWFRDDGSGWCPFLVLRATAQFLTFPIWIPLLLIIGAFVEVVKWIRSSWHDADQKVIEADEQKRLNPWGDQL